MHNPIDLGVVKKHPVMVGGIVVVGGLLVYLALNHGGGSSGGSVAAAAGPTDAQIQAAMAGQQMQYQMGAQASSQQFQLAKEQLDIQGNLALTGLNLQAAHEQVQAGLAVSVAQLDLAKYQTDVSLMAQKDNNATALAGQQAILKNSYDLANLNTTAMMQQNQLQTQSHMFDTQALVDLQTVLSQANAATSITQSNNQVKMAQIQASAQKSASKSSFFGSLLGAGATLLTAFL